MGRIASSFAVLAFGLLIFSGCPSATADGPEPTHPGRGSDTSHPKPTTRAGAGAPGEKGTSAHRSEIYRSEKHSREARRRATTPPASPLVNLPSYWPKFTNTEKRRFDYTSADGSLAPTTAVFSYDRATKSMLYQEYNADMVWQDTWYYRAKPGYGIAEWRDDYPRTTSPWQLGHPGTVKRVIMAVPIGWGENLPVGGEYRNRPRFSVLRSSPPQIGVGRQVVKLEAVLTDFTTGDGTTYHDVIQFLYQQKWGRSQQAGARYWMAKGVGPVAIQWVGEDPGTHQTVESVRIDAVVTITLGGEHTA